MAFDLADPARLALLNSLDLLQPHEDAAFDRVTAIAALATGRPTALITFIGPDGQWVASRQGWHCTFHPLTESFCLHALKSGQPLEVCDASTDTRFVANMLVTGSAGVRFYAGHPIFFEGHLLGAVCVLDGETGQLTPNQSSVLKQLSDVVSDLLRVRLERSRVQEEQTKVAGLVNALEVSEVTLRESEERYRLLWQSTMDAVVILDERNVVRFANPALSAVFGYAPDDVVGRDLGMLQPARLRPAHDRAFFAYQRTGKRTLNWRAIETIGLRKDGTEVPIEISFSELEVAGQRHFAAFIRDLSARNEVQLALRRSEAQFRALTALSADWYWELDSEMRYTFISDGAKRNAGMDSDRLIGSRPWDSSRVIDEQREKFKSRMLRHEAFRDLELAKTGPDGLPLVLSISGEPVFNESGSFAGYRGVGRNVTKERLADQARRELEEHLRESQKLEAIGVLAGGIAHDFNNLVAGVLGNTQLALDDLDAAHPAVQSLKQIRKAGIRGRAMVQQILTFARRKPKRPAHCELGELVAETLGLLRPTVPTSVKLESILPERPLPVFADPTQVEQALINLCANAWQAMDGRSGHIEISAEEVVMDRGAAERHAGLTPGRYVHLTVTDDGPGMDEVTSKRVFEPFFTTKPEGQGTGLGLSVVHGIVTGHGGAISVESIVGSGTTFHVWLPADVEVGGTEPAPLVPALIDGAGRHVLYVDDDEVMTVMVGRLLERAGYRVSTFNSGADALESFEQSPWTVDVVVTDLNMPGLSGLDVLERVGLLRPGLPVIIGSGNLPQELLDDLEQRGVRGTFNKQNMLEELPPLLAAALGLR